MSSTVTPSDLFPNLELTTLPTDRKPNLHDIRQLKRQINANAMAIPSRRGGGLNGHLAICMLPADYNVLPNVAAPWVDPPLPGPNPIIPAGATAAVIAETNRQYKVDCDEFATFKAAEAAIRRCLIQAIPSTYIDILADDVFEYALVEPRAIIAHMQANYGLITQDDLIQNMEDLKRQWDPTQPLEDLWKQLRRCQVFAANHDPITNATLVREAIINLENTGVFIDALKDWRKRLPAAQTLAQLKIDFNAADKERRRTLTSRDAGYANAAVKQMVQDNKENLGLYYCWTHGLGRNADHTSKTCTNKAHGHQLDSTLFNMLGGNNRIHRGKNERAIYQHPKWESNGANPTGNRANGQRPALSDQTSSSANAATSTTDNSARKPGE